MAMAAERSGRLFNAAFGSMAEEARKWATDVSSSLKVNQRDVEKAAAGFQLMFDNMGVGSEQAVQMTKDLTELGSKLEIIYGLNSGEGAQQLMSGLSGQGESLRKFGIIVKETAVEEYALRQGWIQHGQKLNEVGRAYVSYRLIMEQSKKATEGLAGVEKDLGEQRRRAKDEWNKIKEIIGTGLSPHDRIDLSHA